MVITTIKLGQAAADITAQAADLEIRAAASQLALPAQAGSAHHRPQGQAVDVGIQITDPGIPRLFTGENDRQRQTMRQRHGHIFHGMNGDIGTTVEQGFFQLLDE